MKTISGFLIILATMFAPLAHAASHYSLQVDGLACPFCAYGIEKKLSTIKGLKVVSVDVEQGRISVTLPNGTTLSEHQARDKIQQAGFTLRGITQVEGQ